ncbi:3'(2'),5'-bisphosphate nucleotidase 1 isoform X1 [Scyliorhinus torazame]|uniref:3'(2'),5'-bisphosphate nucleotidase 1 isoform X1 n=1 Tax=Scyliorhinus torazame TaxID=75743 RepID=UPI003B599192
MSASPALLMRLVASGFSIAEKAQAIVQQVMSGGDLGVVEKTGANDLQTKADRLVQLSICSSLARKFPKLTIIGEEDLPFQHVDEDLIESGQSEEVLKYSCPPQYSHIKEDEIVVWVDPLDGTKEYTEGLLDHVTVLIGFAYAGKAIAGVINQPYYNYQAGAGAVLGRTIWGVLNLGVFGIQLKEAPEGKHIITTTRSHSSKLVNDCICAMKADEVIRVGGAGNKSSKILWVSHFRRHASDLKRLQRSFTGIMPDEVMPQICGDNRAEVPNRCFVTHRFEAKAPQVCHKRKFNMITC